VGQLAAVSKRAVGKQADVVWLLICGSTNPMQLRVANAQVRFQYADGEVEKLELVPPLNFWSLCPWAGEITTTRWMPTVCPRRRRRWCSVGQQLPGDGTLLELRPHTGLESVTLESLSQDVVIA